MQEPWSDGTLPEDPPYNPVPNVPEADVSAADAFDPDDEPLDEEINEKLDEPRQPSEQEALRLLQQELGAEKIGEEELH